MSKSELLGMFDAHCKDPWEKRGWTGRPFARWSRMLRGEEPVSERETLSKFDTQLVVVEDALHN